MFEARAGQALLRCARHHLRRHGVTTTRGAGLHDLPRHLVLRQIVRRTTRRVVRREELWNGNRERLGAVLNPDPHRSIIRWAWTRHGMYRERYATRIADPRWAGLAVVRLRSRAEVDLFVRSLAGPGPPSDESAKPR